MKEITIVAILLSLLVMDLNAQIVEIDGKAKITVMDTATATAQPVAIETDGTLSLMSRSPTYNIGDYAHGGVVFWVNPSGTHGKVVSMYTIQDVLWSGAYTTNGPKARSSINGAGNTAVLYVSLFPAAHYCVNLAYGGYDDWYLPSTQSLLQIFDNFILISTVSSANGGESLQYETYWSSMEHNTNDANALSYPSPNGGIIVQLDKGSLQNVRAIRSF